MPLNFDGRKLTVCPYESSCVEKNTRGLVVERICGANTAWHVL